MITADLTTKIDQVSEEIWSSMVNVPITLTDKRTAGLVPAKTVTSSVQIIGCWNGAVSVDMGADLARHATASLVGGEVSEMSHDDVRDAAGELANMTAGGIKELLPDPCQISLPTVVMGSDFELTIPEGVVVYRSVFSTDYGEMAVTLIQGGMRR
jgi:chemotaxis protein CheX